jgi:parallel beta-helix repeat protein
VRLHSTAKIAVIPEPKRAEATSVNAASGDQNIKISIIYVGGAQTEMRILKRTLSGLSIAAVAMLLSVGLTVLAAPSRAHAAACTTTITACGCTITSGGLSTPYNIANNLGFAPTSGDCIDVAASSVELLGNSHTITGPGSATGTVGIHVLTGANLAIVDGVTTTGFGVGIQADGKEPFILASVSESNGVGFVLNGSASVVYDAVAETNLFAGFKVSPTAGGSTILVASSIGNTVGFKLVRVSGTAMYAVTATGNAAFGFWLNGAYDSNITGLTAQDNTVAGIYLGCNAAGPIGTPCPAGTPASAENVIQSDLFSSSGPSNVSPTGPGKQRYGIAIDRGNLRNRIFRVAGSGNSIFDAFDENPGCGTNDWGALLFTNTFTTVSPTTAASGNLFCID